MSTGTFSSPNRSLFHRSVAILLLAALLMALLPGAVLAAPAAAASPALAASGHVTYTVTYGDTLSKIAGRYGVTVQAIMNANGITNPNRIYVGQVLRIPSSGSVGCRAYYTVQAGDTLFRIASRHGVDVYALAQANNLLNLNTIYVGRVLCIPGGTVPPPAPPPGQTVSYTVKSGDTLYKIAGWYNTTVQAIMNANGISNPNRIYVGQVLRVSGPGAPAPTPTPTPQPQPGAWTGLYYANKDLSGSPALVRQDADIKFNWGTGSPAANIPADNFSVLWTRTFNYAGGTYRFFATADDGVRVYLDGVLVIDAWREQPATSYFGDIYISPGVHTIRVEYFEATQSASINFYWAKL